ncbi:bifunctional aspartate kinase/homoserine dehydrogenase I [Myxococcota bacterium]|nr:bifunctional aspartate kinase/homoserine dehydrogenase I [Myxococcota bacterium]
MNGNHVRVMKFGGTSVGSPDRLERVVEIVADAWQEGPLVVVVSAMQHSTDRLIEAADLAVAGRLEEAERVLDELMDLTTTNGLVGIRAIEERVGARGERVSLVPPVRERFTELRQLLYGVSLLRERTPQTLDLVLSFGERLSAAVLAALLKARGLPARMVDSREWLVTDDGFGAARVECEESEARLLRMAAGWEDVLPVVTGFIGATRDGRTTTLGRNGSDYTATLLAKFLGAREVVVWTDVSGVMTADPGIVKDAYPLSHLSYMEALELVDFGASMFHPRTLIPLIETGIPMRIRNTMVPGDPGTLIDARGASDRSAATSVTSLENLALLGVQVRRIAKQAPVGGRLLRAMEGAGLTIWMSSQSAHGQAFAVVVPAGEQARAREVIEEELALELGRGEVESVAVRSPVTLLTLVAEAMGQTVGVAGRFFHALGGVGVNIRAAAQGASSRSISCVIDAEDTQVAVRTVHAAFNLAHQQVSLLVLGKGTVGGHLLAQIASERSTLAERHDADLDVVGVAGRRGVAFDPEGLDLERWEERMVPWPVEGAPDLRPLLDRLRRLPVPVLVDCTAADGMEAIYEEAFERGIHVVAANKKPLTIPWEARERMMESARRNHRFYHYETTVGASLPVIDTLKNLVRTGDRVRRIEGSFSGTLGFVVHEVMAGRRLSEAVRQARDLGYTEPNPAEDLSGMDVARKALILARELGLPLSLADVRVAPLVDLDLEPGAGVEAFFEALEGADETFGRWRDGVTAEGKVIRYLARIDPDPGSGKPVVTVGPMAVAPDHPSTRLRGTEAFVAFTTDRFQEHPLLVQGSGAGGAVTAAGVLADILKVSMTLRGR